jgi:type II secretory pathway pseudopilin PulG
VSDNTKIRGWGFTIPELAVSISILGLLLVSLLGASTYYFSVITRNNVLVEMTTDSQNLLRSAVEELRYGTGVKQSNTIPDPNAPASGWNTSNDDFVIIIAVPALNNADQYIIDPNTGSPYSNELVYFKSAATLYKRVLANPAATDNKMVTSCPQALSTDECPPDKKMADSLKTMLFTLYDQDDAPTSNPLLARSVLIDLGLERDTFGDPLALDTSIRVTLRNNF